MSWRLLVVALTLLLTLSSTVGIAIAFGSALQTDMIAFNNRVDDDLDVFIIDVVTGLETRITTPYAADHGMVWSPDGKRLAILSNVTGWDQLHIIAFDLGLAQHVIALETDEIKARDPFQMPQWSADGERVILLRRSFGQGMQSTLHHVDVMTRQVEPIDQGHPDWTHYIQSLQRGSIHSPDGRYVAMLDVTSDEHVAVFVGEPAANDAIHDQRLLYRISNRETYHRSEFSWSPDGKKIALTVVGSDISHLIVVDVATGLHRILAEDVTAVSVPAWRP